MKVLFTFLSKNGISDHVSYYCSMVIFMHATIFYGWIIWKFIDEPSVRLTGYLYQLVFVEGVDDYLLRLISKVSKMSFRHPRKVYEVENDEKVLVNYVEINNSKQF
jgi:hypothetical protein